jgi:hypothetical protein
MVDTVSARYLDDGEHQEGNPWDRWDTNKGENKQGWQQYGDPYAYDENSISDRLGAWVVRFFNNRVEAMKKSKAGVD